MEPRPPRLTRGAVAVAVALALSGAAGARATAAATTRSREAAAGRTATATARAFETAVAGVAHSVDALALLAPAVARTPATPPAALGGLVSPRGFAAVVVVPARGVPVVAAGTLPAAVTVGTLAAALGPALELARDTADPHAGPVSNSAAVAVAVYSGPVLSTEQRRGTLTAWVVGIFDPAALVAQVSAPADHVAVRLGGALLTAATSRGPVAAESTVHLGGQPWQAVVTPDVDDALPVAAWGMLALGLAGAAAAAFVGARGRGSLADAVAAADALERETRTIAELGPLLQQSLDLAEVLPAVAVRLSDEFGLDVFAVELIGEHGDLVDVFATGRRRGTAEPVGFGKDGIAAGVEVALPLLRGGRTIGRMRLVAHDALVPAQVDALRGASDLIAAATYNVELYEREQATVRRLQDLDRLKDAFLGTISHELRTPLTAIGGFARMLNDRYDDLTEEQRRDFLRRVERNSASLGLLVDDLLDFARLERQALSTNIAPVALDALVGAFVAQVVPALGDHEIVTDLAPGVFAMADPRAIERVLANLLTNAAKFSPAGTPVEVGLRSADRVAVLTVSDCGPGIAEEDRLRVFGRFYRGESPVARSTRGAGIGLAVVHELVTQMTGTIEITSRHPQGTAMVVRLPLATTAEPPAPRASPDAAVPARSAP